MEMEKSSSTNVVMTAPPPATPPVKDFAIGLFDIGDTTSCLFSFLCPGWAMAQSRSMLDGSDCMFNFMCLNPCAYRWMVRSAYGIGDASSCGDDCMYSTCCSCCVANQVYQTTKAYGHVSPTDAGPLFNQTEFNNNFSSGNGALMRCLGAFFCTQCMMGQVMERSIGMPFWLGLCWVNPFLGRNLMRYHYRIRPHTNNDFTEECLVPTGVVCLDSVIKPSFPLIDCVFRGVLAAFVMQMAKEAEIRGPAENRQYIAGYSHVQRNTALDVSSNGVVSVAPAMVVSNPMYAPQQTYPAFASHSNGYGYGPVPGSSPNGRIVYVDNQL
jgi:hypothetical protein